jgi:hypothetical protein
MSFQDHLKTCSYCKKGLQTQTQKVTVSVKSTSSYYNQKKLAELGAIIKGTSYTGLDTDASVQTRGASVVKNNPRKLKLRELGKIVRGKGKEGSS